MDPLSISASIVALVQFTGTIIGYITNAKGASDERTRILEELKNVHYILYQLKDQVEASQFDQPSVTLTSLHTPLAQFKKVLVQLEKKLRPTEGFGKIGKVLTWHFDKDEVKEILFMVERYKSLFSIALQTEWADRSIETKRALFVSDRFVSFRVQSKRND